MHSVVFFDLEFTAWEGSMAQGWLAPGQFREVVQIGAVKMDAATLETRGEFERLVRPRINRELSIYLENLTGITNAMIAERGIDFETAYREFVSFADGAAIASFGRDDHVLERNLALYGIHDAPGLPPHMNVVPWLAKQGIDMKGLHACDVARMCGAAFEGRAHDALDDARSVAAGMCAVIGRGADNPFAGSK